MLKHHCSAFFISFPSSFSPSIIDETIPSSNCFASYVAETPFASNPSSFIHIAETPIASNLSSFIHDAETQPFSTLFPDTETPVISSSSSIAILRFFSVAATPAFHRQQASSLPNDSSNSKL
jgi:hypothetical protein